MTEADVLKVLEENIGHEFLTVLLADQLKDGLQSAAAEIARVQAEEVAGLRGAAQAVVDRWHTPLWKDAEPTAAVIGRLSQALAAQAVDRGEGGT